MNKQQIDELRALQPMADKGFAAWTNENFQDLLAAYDKLELEKQRLRKAYSTVNEEICQTLGKVLGYPWFKDDLKNFPDATEKDGVCVDAKTIAEEAAEHIKKLQRKYDEAFTGLLGSSRGECIRRERQPEIDKLQNIIKEYGEHKETCYKRWFDQSFDWICTCGFEKKPCPKCNDSGFIGGPVGYDCPICTKEK